jgi:hypothetical protein
VAIEQDSVVPPFFYGFGHPGSTSERLTFPSSIMFYLFLKLFIVVIVNLFQFFVKLIHWYFWSYCKWNFFGIFCVKPFVIGVLKNHWYLKIDFVFCHFADVCDVYELLGIFRYKNMSSTNGSLNSTFPVWISFISSCLIVLA